MLGADYAGVLQRDGWAPSRQFVHAAHQTCAHLLRRCRTMMLDHPYHPCAPQVQDLLQAALATRDRHRRGHVSDQGLAIARGHDVNRLDRLPADAAESTRRRAPLRPAVVTRKMCGGGNRTMRGAQTQQILTSLLRTAHQRGVNTTDALTTLLRSPSPVVLDSFQSTPLH